MAAKSKTPDFQEINEFLIAELKTNRIPWRTAALPTAPINAVTGKRFYGFTALELADRAQQHGVNQFVTAAQIKDANARIAKGTTAAKAYFTQFVGVEKSGIPVIDQQSGRQKVVSELRSFPTYPVGNVTGIAPRETRKWSGAEVDAVLAAPFPAKRDNEHPTLYAIAVDMAKVMVAAETLQAPERSTLPDLLTVASYLAENKRNFFYAADKAQQLADVRLSVDPEYKARLQAERADKAAGKADEVAEKAITDEKRAIEAVLMLAECPAAFDALGDQRKELAVLAMEYASRHDTDETRQAMANLARLREQYVAAAKPAPAADAARAPGM